jgi:hypothetical protein
MQTFQAQEEAQEEGFRTLPPLDSLAAREELVLDLGLAVELQMEEQLGGPAHLLQTSQQVLLLVAAQAEVVGQASLETLAMEEMEEIMVAQVEVEVVDSMVLETLAQVEMERMALLL